MMKSLKMIGLGAVFAVATAVCAYAQEPEAAMSAEVSAEAPAAVEPAPVAEEAASAETPSEAAAPVAEGRVGAPPEGKGLVVFFRPSRFSGGALTFTIRENDTPLGRLPNGRYFVYAADPGVHEFESGRNDTLRLEVEEGETYYIQQNIAMGFMAGRGVLAPADQAAFDEHDNLRLSDPVE